MGLILNPEGENSFTSLAYNHNSGIFVDKTDFIGETINRIDSESKLINFTRPRRFGKTITALMLASYYSKGSKCKDIFSKLKISKYKSIKAIQGQEKEIDYEEFLNKCNVIYWDMNGIETDFKDYKHNEELHVKGVEDIVDYMQYATLKELREVDEFNKKISNGNFISNTSLKKALIATNSKFILIMDEWDLIYRDYRDDVVLQEKFIDMLRGLFKDSKAVSCFSLVYLTGILPIKKYNSQSALNNFKEYNMLQPDPFEKYFGFTDEEIFSICKLPQCHLEQSELKKWYEGYKLNGVDIYNPNSVVSAIRDIKCKNFWSNTSSNEEVVRLINLNFDGIKDDIVKMISGEYVKFDYSTFQNDLVNITDKDQVISLLVCLGYLGCLSARNGIAYAYVPNHEIRNALVAIVRRQNWFGNLELIKRSENLFKAIKALDSKTVAKIVSDIHTSSQISVIGYNREESLAFSFISGLMWCTEGTYESYRELPSGKGFADLVYIPIFNAELPIIIVEFKRDASAEEAMKQIKEKDYAKRFCKDCYDQEIILIGLNYDSETKEHQCCMERMRVK